MRCRENVLFGMICFSMHLVCGIYVWHLFGIPCGIPCNQDCNSMTTTIPIVFFAAIWVRDYKSPLFPYQFGTCNADREVVERADLEYWMYSASADGPRFPTSYLGNMRSI